MAKFFTYHSRLIVLNSDFSSVFWSKISTTSSRSATWVHPRDRCSISRPDPRRRVCVGRGIPIRPKKFPIEIVPSLSSFVVVVLFSSGICLDLARSIIISSFRNHPGVPWLRLFLRCMFVNDAVMSVCCLWLLVMPLFFFFGISWYCLLDDKWRRLNRTGLDSDGKFEYH